MPTSQTTSESLASYSFSSFKSSDSDTTWYSNLFLKHLTKFNKSILASILSESIDQLTVIKNFDPKEGDPHSDDIFDYKDINKRYGIPESDSGYNVNLNGDYLNKLPTDINILNTILQKAIAEIVQHGIWKSLSRTIKAFNRMEKDDCELLQNEFDNKEMIVNITKTIERERLNNIKTLRRTKTEINAHQYIVEDFLVYNNEEKKYFDKWEGTRIEQNKLMCEKRENTHLSSIKEMEDKIEIENRCHLEIEAYLDESKNDFLNDIQHWMKKYDEDLEERDNQLIVLKADKEKQEEAFKRLKNTLEEHRIFIEEWLEHKRLLKEQEERELLEIWAATKIQAWWRGTMYRKKLGPYRKKRRKGKGKGKNKNLAKAKGKKK